MIIMLLEIINNPAGALARAKKNRNMNHSYTVMALSSLLLAVSVALISASIAYNWLNVLVVVFSFSIISIMVLGYIIEVIASTLSGKGKFFEGVTTVSYAAFPVSMGILIASLTFFIPLIGSVIGLLFLLVSFALGISMLYKGVKELFKTDMVTSFVAVSALALTLVLSVYVITLLGIAGMLV